MATNKKIAYIDLSTQHVTIASLPPEIENKFIGGRGIATYLLYTKSVPNSNSLSPENRIVISAGLLGGMVGFPDSHTLVTTKSPVTDSFSSTYCGNSFAPELRWAGFDHLVISGKALNPVYIFIENEKIIIKNSEKLWGLDTRETRRAIRTELKDEEVRVLTIGPAGEKCIPMATLVEDGQTFSNYSGGGAVFGSKNLKAIACKGTMDIEVRYPQEALVCAKGLLQTTNRSKNESIQPSAESQYTPSLQLHNNSVNSVDRLFQPYKNEALNLGLPLQPIITLIEWVQNLVGHKIISETNGFSSNFFPRSGEDALQILSNFCTKDIFSQTVALGPFKAYEVFGSNSLKYYPAPHCVAPSVSSFMTELYSSIMADFFGTSSQYVHYSNKKNSRYNDYLRLIQLNVGNEITQNNLREAAKRCVTLERLFNIREGMTSMVENFEIFRYIHTAKTIKSSGEKVSLRHRFYEFNKWNKQGIPSEKLVNQLKIDELYTSSSLKTKV